VIRQTTWCARDAKLCGVAAAASLLVGADCVYIRSATHQMAAARSALVTGRPVNVPDLLVSFRSGQPVNPTDFCDFDEPRTQSFDTYVRRMKCARIDAL